jgi:hypothetical protein
VVRAEPYRARSVVSTTQIMEAKCRADFVRCSSPLLCAIPIIDVLANLIFREAIPFLNFAFQLILTTVDHIEIIVGELAPLLLNVAFDLLPISLDPIPVHFSLHNSDGRGDNAADSIQFR